MSITSAGVQGNGPSTNSSISAGGRFVGFCSEASNLVGNDGNGVQDVFVRDRRRGTTRRVSVSSAGAEANGYSINPSISADGRFIVFISAASNLVGSDGNGVVDVFVRDRRRGTTRRVSVSSAEVEGNGGSGSRPSISTDGRFVAFTSGASNLVGSDGNGVQDVFVRDRRRGTTRRVSVSSAEVEGNRGSSSGDAVSISADGRFVSFHSEASNLVASDGNGVVDVFVRDRRRGTTRRVSLSSAEVEGNGGSNYASISAGGRFVAFTSAASNLVGSDGNGVNDVFMRDRRRGTTRRVSVSSAGVEADGGSYSASISAYGRFVAMESSASNLIAADGNSYVDVFVRDRRRGTTRRASVSSAGVEANGGSAYPALAASGRFVAFESTASNLVGVDLNSVYDVFVRGPLR